MKKLILLSFALVSFNSFAAQVGESLASDCSQTNQSAKREAKVVEAPVSSVEAPKPTTIAK